MNFGVKSGETAAGNSSGLLRRTVSGGVSMRLFAVLCLSVCFGIVSAQSNRIVPIDDSVETGRYTDIITVNGLPAMAFFDSDARKLAYSRATAADGSAWGAIVRPDQEETINGWYPTMAIVNGHPAIAHYSDTTRRVKYIRATDADGTTWTDAPVTVNTANGGWYVSLAVVANHPAVAYHDLVSRDLVFCRSDDVNGVAWTTFVTLASSGDTGRYSTLLTLSDNTPAVVFYNANDDDLLFVSAADTAGAAWNAVVTITSAGSIGDYASGALVAGFPAATYYHAGAQSLMFVRALDAAGTTWGTPVTLDDTSSDTGKFSTLGTVGGLPAVCYLSISPKEARVVIAQDAVGGTWWDPVTVDSSEDVYTGLVPLNTEVGCSYRNLDGASQFARFAAVPLPSPSASHTATPSQTASPSSTPSASATASATPSATPSATASASATAAATASSSATATQSASQTPSASATASMTASVTTTPSPSSTSGESSSSSSSATPSASASASATPSASATASSSATASATASASASSSASSSTSSSASPSASASMSPTPSVSKSSTSTASESTSLSSTATISTTTTATATPTVSVSATISVSPTTSVSVSATRSPSPSEGSNLFINENGSGTEFGATSISLVAGFVGLAALAALFTLCFIAGKKKKKKEGGAAAANAVSPVGAWEIQDEADESPASWEGPDGRLRMGYHPQPV